MRVRPRPLAELLGPGRLADALAHLGGLPLRPASVRAVLDLPLTGRSAPRATGLPAHLSLLDIDPGWIVATRLGPRLPESLCADLHWWRAPDRPEQAAALDRLWRNSVATALTTFRLARAAGDPEPELHARAAMLTRLDLWALAALETRLLAQWMDASLPERTDLELAWFGEQGPAMALRLARAWGPDDLLVETLARQVQTLPEARPLHRRSSLAARAQAEVELGAWSLRGPLHLPNRRDPDRASVDARVQAVCAEEGLAARPSNPAVEPTLRALLRERAETTALRQALSQRSAPPSPRPLPPNPLGEPELEALAEFAAGAAHELNNPLAVIAGRAQLLLSRTDDPDIQRSLRTIQQQARRAHQMLRDLIYVGRPPAQRPRPCVPSGILGASVADLQPEARTRGLRLELSRQGPARTLLLDPDGLRHLADVLIRNGIEVAQPPACVQLAAREDHHGLVWTIHTPGVRLTAEQAAHLFHPFYSGRQAGRGLGLGLPRAARWLDRAGGAIRMRTHPAGGTTFRVEVPGRPTDLPVERSA